MWINISTEGLTKHQKYAMMYRESKNSNPNKEKGPRPTTEEYQLIITDKKYNAYIRKNASIRNPRKTRDPTTSEVMMEIHI